MGDVLIKTWFSADLHLGHFNILRYCNRPFKSVKIMDNTLIRNWNSRVKEEDEVIFLGDFCFGDPAPYLRRLRGNIVFCKGNHDDGLNARITYLVIEAGGKEMYCTHSPEDYSTAYSINLIGHVHDRWKWKKLYKTTMINVGTDAWGYKPVSIEEVLEYVKKEVGK